MNIKSRLTFENCTFTRCLVTKQNKVPKRFMLTHKIATMSGVHIYLCVSGEVRKELEILFSTRAFQPPIITVYSVHDVSRFFYF